MSRIVSPWNAYAKILTSGTSECGCIWREDLERQLRLNEVIWVNPYQMWLVSLQRRKLWHRFLQRKDHVRPQGEGRRREASGEISPADILISNFQLLKLWESEFLCINHSVCGTWLRQPQHTNTACHCKTCGLQSLLHVLSMHWAHLRAQRYLWEGSGMYGCVNSSSLALPHICDPVFISAWCGSLQTMGFIRPHGFIVFPPAQHCICIHLLLFWCCLADSLSCSTKLRPQKALLASFQSSSLSCRNT